MKTILALLLVAGLAESVRAQTARDVELDQKIDDAVRELAKAEAEEMMSCLFPSKAAFVSDKGRAVEKYLAVKKTPDAPAKRARAIAAREAALRAGGVIQVSEYGYECRLDYGKDYVVR